MIGEALHAELARHRYGSDRGRRRRCRKLGHRHRPESSRLPGCPTRPQELHRRRPRQRLHGHGTHCAGTIFGRDVDGMRIGVARGVKKALIGKVLGRDGGGERPDRHAPSNGRSTRGARGSRCRSASTFPGFQRQLTRRTGSRERPLRARWRATGRTCCCSSAGARRSVHGSVRQPALIVAAAGNESQRRRQPGLRDRREPARGVRWHHLGGRARPGRGRVRGAPFSNTGARSPGRAWTSFRPSAAAGWSP